MQFLVREKRIPPRLDVSPLSDILSSPLIELGVIICSQGSRFKRLCHGILLKRQKWRNEDCDVNSAKQTKKNESWAKTEDEKSLVTRREILYLLLRMYSLLLCKYKGIFGTFVTWQHFLFRYNRAVFSQRVKIWIVIVNTYVRFLNCQF